MGNGRDYVAIARQYAKDAVADRRGKRHGRWIRRSAERFLTDLQRARRRGAPFRFDPWHANDACGFLELLPHVEGVWEEPELTLHPAQVFFVVQLFGFRNHAGGRRFTSALYATARKSGKSTLAAGILLYCLCCENEPGAQIITAATTYDQAAVIFKIAAAMVGRTVDLREAFGLEAYAKAIARMPTGASFRALHAKASTQDGLNPSHVALDEVHAHKSPDLLNVLTSAAGARGNPLWLYCTTEGYQNAGPWPELKQFALQLLDGVFGTDGDHFLALVYAVDPEDDEFDEAAWVKANPLIDQNPHLLTAIRKEAVEARAMPSKLAEFRIKRLNRASSTATGWIDLPKWQACNGLVDLDWLAQHPCTGAFDLASTMDLTSWRLTWLVNGVWYTWGRRWVPADAVQQRTVRGTVPYAGWVEAALVEQTDGNVTDYTVIETAIREDFKRFKITSIAFDRWNAQEISTRLLEDGLPLVEFQQNTRAYHPAMQELERAYVAGNFRHGGDPVLQWCASNLVAYTDLNMCMKPSKKKSADKIDDMATLLMAMGTKLAEVKEPPKSIYVGFISA